MSDGHGELTMDIETADDTATVRCRGRVSLVSASQLRRDVKGLLPHVRFVTIDFTDVTSIDSVGLGTVAALYASARTAGCDLTLVNISPRIRELFTVTRLLSLFEPCGDANIRLP